MFFVPTLSPEIELQSNLRSFSSQVVYTEVRPSHAHYGLHITCFRSQDQCYSLWAPYLEAYLNRADRLSKCNTLM